MRGSLPSRDVHIFFSFCHFSVKWIIEATRESGEAELTGGEELVGGESELRRQQGRADLVVRLVEHTEVLDLRRPLGAHPIIR